VKKPITNKIKQLIDNSHSIAIFLHQNPDGDSIGSSLALWHWLQNQEKNTALFSPSQIDQNFSFLPGFDQIKIINPEKFNWQKWDLIIFPDIANRKQIGFPAGVVFPKEKTIVIDHHLTNTRFGNVNLVSPEKSSTAEIVYQLLKALKERIMPVVATCLLVGINTDTGGFTFFNTKPETLITAGELARISGQYQEIIFRLYHQVDLRKVKFIAKALDRLRVDLKRQCAWIGLPHSFWKKYATGNQDAHFLTAWIKKIKGTKIGFIISERNKGKIYLNFRSRDPNIDVSQLAEIFGGGGHKVAAGARITGKSLNQVIRMVLKQIDLLYPKSKS